MVAQFIRRSGRPLQRRLDEMIFSDVSAVRCLFNPPVTCEGMPYSLGRSDTLKKFHSHVLPLSGEKA